MTDKKYDPKKYALSLGFSEDDAIRLASNNTPADNIERIARNRGMLDEKQPDTQAEGKAEPKPHQHYYRKDGKCACGAVRRAKKGK